MEESNESEVPSCVLHLSLKEDQHSHQSIAAGQQKVAKVINQSPTADVAVAGCLHKGTTSLKSVEVQIYKMTVACLSSLLRHRKIPYC